MLGRFAQSSIGAKWVMAVTGILFFLWIVGHLLGNLQVFQGSDAINGYAAFLRREPALLWTARIGLIVVVILHIWAALRLSYLNRKARPERYQGYRYRRATWVTRTMLWSGLLLLAFIVFHLLHFTFGGVFPSEFHAVDALGRHDVYGMLIKSFSRGGIVAIYVGGMILLGLHLSHGIWSATQTYGLNGKRWTPFALQASRVIGAVIAAGFIAIPLAILIGIAHP